MKYIQNLINMLKTFKKTKNSIVWQTNQWNDPQNYVWTREYETKNKLREINIEAQENPLYSYISLIIYLRLNAFTQ